MQEQPNTNKPAASPSDHLANERTFLAWIRTSIALMGFGFVVVKFSLFIKQLSVVLAGKVILPGKGFSEGIGIALVAMGALLALLSYVRYYYTEKQLLNKTYKPSFVLSLSLTIAIVLISLLLLWYLLPSL
ncbi:MAG: YidH family protein [Mucilaginibacter sp.]|uniref:YidH family protein n=1 Tax=Mucilaginibacter sp. TaxID=1882438 RepID=UPI0034E52AA6